MESVKELLGHSSVAIPAAHYGGGELPACPELAQLACDRQDISIV
jgi:hypothetical protein